MHVKSIEIITDERVYQPQASMSIFRPVNSQFRVVNMKNWRQIFLQLIKVNKSIEVLHTIISPRGEKQVIGI